MKEGFYDKYYPVGDFDYEIGIKVRNGEVVTIYASNGLSAKIHYKNRNYYLDNEKVSKKYLENLNMYLKY